MFKNRAKHSIQSSYIAVNRGANMLKKVTIILLMVKKGYALKRVESAVNIMKKYVQNILLRSSLQTDLTRCKQQNERLHVGYRAKILY